jgi:pimeloyl-ACP methyl ester carboxylesterase
MDRNRLPARTTLAAGAVAALAGGAAVAIRRVDAKWAATHDPIPPADRVLPVGERRTVTTDDGAELALTIAGPADGPTVVLAHGWTNGREVWAPVAHRLIRAGHRVVLYDQRGHGSSTSGRDGFTIPRLGADLHAVLEAVDARDAVLVGHSMGGMTIQSLATHHPEVLAGRASAIVLVSTAAAGLGRDARSDRSAQRMVGGRALQALLTTGKGHAFFRGILGATVRRVDLLLAQELFLATAPEARSGWLVAMQGMDLREGIATIDLPTTVLIGSHDRLTPRHLADELAATIPGARLVHLEGHGHMLPLEAPEAVADAVLAATADHPAIGRNAGSLA